MASRVWEVWIFNHRGDNTELQEAGLNVESGSEALTGLISIDTQETRGQGVIAAQQKASESSDDRRQAENTCPPSSSARVVQYLQAAPWCR